MNPGVNSAPSDLNYTLKCDLECAPSSAPKSGPLLCLLYRQIGREKGDARMCDDDFQYGAGQSRVALKFSRIFGYILPFTPF